MKWTAAPDRMTPPAAGVLVTAVAALGLLIAFNTLWHNAASPAALDAIEGIATLAWLLGWGLLIAAVVASLAWLTGAIQDVLAHRCASVTNAITLVAAIAIMIAAMTITPAWGIGSGTA